MLKTLLAYEANTLQTDTGQSKAPASDSAAAIAAGEDASRALRITQLEIEIDDLRAVLLLERQQHAGRNQTLDGLLKQEQEKSGLLNEGIKELTIEKTYFERTLKIEVQKAQNVVATGNVDVNRTVAQVNLNLAECYKTNQAIQSKREMVESVSAVTVGVLVAGCLVAAGLLVFGWPVVTVALVAALGAMTAYSAINAGFWIARKLSNKNKYPEVTNKDVVLAPAATATLTSTAEALRVVTSTTRPATAPVDVLKKPNDDASHGASQSGSQQSATRSVMNPNSSASASSTPQQESAAHKI